MAQKQQSIFIIVHLVQVFAGSAVTHWFLYSINVGRLCKRGAELSIDHHLVVYNS